ncbi:MAG: ketoacyl-ACP synthase III [Gammaproteobacteria bacterium]
MTSTEIYSVGSELAKSVVSTRDLLEEARIEDSLLVENSLGILEVRQAPASAKPSELAIPAAEKAIESSKLPLSSIDAVIYCGIERDCPEPATAHIIASALGIHPKICFDVANACHGFTSGLHVASSMIKGRDIQHALVVTAELSSNVTREVTKAFRNNSLGQEDIKTHLGAFTVGDAGGAMILGPGDEDKGIKMIRSGAVSDHYKLCSYTINNGNISFMMDMGRISAVTLKLLREMVGPAYGELDWTPDDVDLFIPHQVGARPFQKLLDLVGIENDKSIATYPYLGNLASATIPVCYDMLQQQGKMKPGSKILVASSGSGIVATFMGLTL